jgi:hypothetical protein
MLIKCIHRNLKKLSNVAAYYRTLITEIQIPYQPNFGGIAMAQPERSASHGVRNQTAPPVHEY